MLPDKMIKDRAIKYEKPEGLEKKIADWRDPSFSEGAIQILEKRYLGRNDVGEIIETPKELLYRVAHVISQADRNYEDFSQEESERKFYDLMAEGKFFPNSPTLSGAGKGINLAACYKLPIEDSREGIFIDGLYGAIDIQAHGGGTGFNFSKLRPRGAKISTTGGISCGPIPFLKIFDYAIGPVIAQGGTRNGANMGILNYNHPDIEEFIDSKRDGGITNFNLSVGVTEEFMEKVKKEDDYALIDHKGKEVKKVNAKKIFDRIVDNAWADGCPGIIFLDRLEKGNPTPAAGIIDGTNPCGEQPLLDYESCNLGSINLQKFVRDGQIDYSGLEQTVHDAVHFLDNIIDVNIYPLRKSKEEQEKLGKILEKIVMEEEKRVQILEEFSQSPIEKMVKSNRKIGLGIMGFADMLQELNISYGSPVALTLASQVMDFIDKESKNASVKLAETRGKFPNWEESIYNSKSKYFSGKELTLRNATTTTIAPTGTLSTLAGVEGGIEPLFMVSYFKKAIFDRNGNAQIIIAERNKNFERIAMREGFFSEKLMEKIAENGGTLVNIERPSQISYLRWEELKRVFVTANELSIKEHIDTQVAFQKYVDNAVSKTINMKKSAPKEWVEKTYMLAYTQGLKGITIFRDGSKGEQVRSAGQSAENKSTLMGERPKVIGTTIPQKTPHGTAYITLNLVDGDSFNEGTPYETFITIGKGGKDMSAIGEGYGRLASLALKHGVPLPEMIEQLAGIGGGTQMGFGENRVSSLPDALSQGWGEAYDQLTKLGNQLSKKESLKEKFSGNFCECGGPIKGDGCCGTCIVCGLSKCK